MPISELDVGEKKKFEYDGKEFLLINQEGIFAIENICPHMNLPLDIGQITDEGTILCPYHNSEFCFRSGEVRKWVGLQPKEVEKDCEPLTVIPTQEADSYIWIQKPGHDMKQKIINVEQSQYWNEKSGPKWVKNEDALNERLSILTDELFSRAKIKASDKVLDIGCGGGDTTFRVSKLLADAGHVVGADISNTLLNHAKSKFSDIDTMTFVHCDAQNFSFDENYFDKVISRFGVMFSKVP